MQKTGVSLSAYKKYKIQSLVFYAKVCNDVIILYCLDQCDILHDHCIRNVDKQNGKTNVQE